jgi:polyhydroxyalkanoate synthesis regulator phasin
MAQRPDLSKYLDAGAQFVALTRAQARARAKELVNQGQLAQEQVQGFVDDLVEESRRRTDDMLDVVRREIQRQVKALGIATKDDLARLEARLATRTTTPAARATKPATAKKATVKKATVKKATGRKSTAKKKKAAGTKTVEKAGAQARKAMKGSAS